MTADNSTAVGQATSITGDRGTAIGQAASVTGNNSVAIGSGAVAERDNSVSVGSAGAERQITNVAAGTAPTDAVNVQQMSDAVRSSRADAFGGVAAAMAVAGLPQSTQPGRTFVALAGSTYGGEFGSALGVSYMSRDGRWTIKAAANTSSRGEVGAVIGGGMYWWKPVEVTAGTPDRVFSREEDPLAGIFDRVPLAGEPLRVRCMLSGKANVTLLPRDLLPGVDIYGQNEIYELAQDETSRVQLLDRFLPQDGDYESMSADVHRHLKESQQKLTKSLNDLDELKAQVAAVPTLPE